MWLTVLILSFFSFGPSQAGKNDGNCEIDNFTDNSWLIYLEIPGKVYDNENNKIVYESPYTGNLTDLQCTCTSSTCNSNYEYITIYNNASAFIISTSDHMTDLDKDTEKSSNPSIKLVYSCEMKCNTALSSILPVVIDIYDYNNHAPVFEVDSYTYKVASPIMPISDFTLFGNSIEAEDLDFSNNNITFTIEPNDFTISTTVDYTNNKKYIANVRANKAIVLTESVTYKLTATDSGTDPKPLNTTVDIVIDVDESLSWDVPSFEYSDNGIAAYVFEYVSTSDQLNPLTGSIKLNTNKPNSIEDIQLLGEMKDYFTVEYVNETKTFDLSSSTIENPTSSSTILTLSLKTDFEVSTPIIIKFSDVSSDTVSFKEHSYTGSYDDVNNVLSVNGDIELTISTSGTPTFAITGDFSDNFSVEYDENTKVCTLTVDPALTPAQIRSQVYLTLTLQATVDDHSDRTVIIIQLPSHTLEFTEILYTATYNDDDTVSIDATNPIAFTNATTGINVTVEEAYSTYFKVNENLTIDVEEPLSSEILSTETEIAIVLTAEDVYSNKVQAVVKMVLPLQETIEAPKFSQPYYIVEYNDTEEYIDFDVALAFDNIEDPSTVTIDLNAYSDNFKLVYKNKKWIIQIEKHLDTDTLNNNNELILTMTATEKSSTAKGLGVLVVLIEKSDAPEFSQLSYLAQYTQGQTENVDFKEPVDFQNVKDPNLITISLNAYNDNFQVYYDKSTKKWRIKIKKALDSDTFDTTSELVIKMTATETGNSKTGAAVLVIELIDSTNEEEPKFSNISYIAQYTRGQTEDSDFTTELSFANVNDNTKIDIALNSYDENFKVYYNTTTKKWRIEIKKALDSDIFDTTSQLVIKMIATETGNSKTGAAVLVIELIDSTNEEEPKFSNISYIAQYTRGQTEDSDFTTELSFANVNDYTKIDIALNSYDENFKVYYNTTSKQWRIEIKKALDSDIFDTTSELVIKMIATETGNSKTGAAVLVIELINPNNEDVLQYSDIFYVAQYAEKSIPTYIDFDKSILFKSDEDMSKISIDIDDYINNFEVIYTDQKWRLHVKSPLDNTVLDVKQDLILIMTATQTETNRTGKSVLIIELIEDLKIPQFEHAYYTAIYPDDGNGEIDFLNDVILNNVDDISKVTITIPDYADNFNVSYDNSTTTPKWVINIVTPLDNATLSSNTYLTSTLTAQIEGDDQHTPAAGFVLKLPEQKTKSAPIFSKSYFVAQYTIKDNEAKVTFKDKIEFSNEVDVGNIEIISDEYSDYLSFEYNTTKKRWEVETNGILDTTSLDRLNLVVAITATDTTTNLQGRSVIDLKLPKVNEEDAPRFSKTYYKANYDLSAGQPDVILEDSIDFLNRNNMSTISITTNNYTENFKVSYTGNKWKITVTKNLDQSILNNRVDIIMELIASDSTDSTSRIGQATLLITLPVVNNDDAPKFSSIFYESQCNSTTKILETFPTITINNKEDLSKINVSILENDYQSNFDIQYKSASKSWEISVVSLPEDVETLGKSLVLTLTASDSENTNIGQAALIINFPVDAPKFSSDQYFGSYEIIEDTPSFTMDDVIITNKDNQSNIILKLSSPDGDLSSNFNYSFDDEKKIWKITLDQSFDDDFINGKTQLILTLTATEDYNTNQGFATVIINLPTEDTENDLTFSSIHYEGNYSIVEDVAVVELNEKIQLISTQDLTSVLFSFVVSDNINANDYFSIDQTSNTDYYDVKVVKELPASILKNQRSLVVTLQATLGKSKSSTTLVINLPIPGEENTIEFSKLLYNGNYSSGVVTVEDINIITNEVSGNLEVTISKDSPYRSYFSVELDDKAVVLTATDIPSDVLDEISVISLTLQAASTGTSKTGTAIVNIDTKYYRGSLQFSSVVFNGKYDVINNDKLTVDPITLVTDVEDELISVTLDNAMESYFIVSYSSSEVSLTLTSNIPDEYLQNSTLTLVLTATILDTDIISQAVVNLRIISDTQPDTDGILKFNDILFTAQYSVRNGQGIFKQDEDIGLTTDRSENEIVIRISEASPLEEHFNISYKNQKVTVSLKDNIPDDDFRSRKLISLTMIASTTNNSISTSAVLNVILNNDGTIDNGYISFDSVVYNGKYTVENNIATIDYDNDITVSTDQEDSKIVATIEQPFDAYFNVVYLNKLIKLDLLTTSADTALRSNKNLPVVVTVQIKDTTQYSSTVINFMVVDIDNGDEDTGPISFPSQIYNGVYDVDSNSFTRDVIRVITDHPDGDIEVKISNEYNYDTYFEVEYKINEIIIDLKKALPKNDVKNLGSIALAIRARLKNHQTIYGDSVLNIKIQDKSLDNEGSSNTKYIIAVSVLSVLLFLVIIGVMAFYILIFRKRKYEKMTEEDYINSKVKFDRSALKRPSTERTRSSAIEERRPTGYVFTNTDSADVKETNTDTSENTRKKSVAFDENVEKLQIEGVNDEDIERALGETTEL